MNDFELDKELARKETFDLGDMKVFIERKDPYGFWYASVSKGPLHPILSGVFTTRHDARVAVKHFQTERNQPTRKQRAE